MKPKVYVETSVWSYLAARPRQVTWNFRHIANVRTRREVERILVKHGYTKTTICTPEELA